MTNKRVAVLLLALLGLWCLPGCDLLDRLEEGLCPVCEMPEPGCWMNSDGDSICLPWWDID